MVIDISYVVRKKIYLVSYILASTIAWWNVCYKRDGSCRKYWQFFMLDCLFVFFVILLAIAYCRNIFARTLQICLSITSYPCHTAKLNPHLSVLGLSFSLIPVSSVWHGHIQHLFTSVLLSESTLVIWFLSAYQLAVYIMVSRIWQSMTELTQYRRESPIFI